MTDPINTTTPYHRNLIGMVKVLLGIALVIFPGWYFVQTSMEFLTQYRANEELAVHEEFYKERSATLQIRKQRATMHLNKLEAQLQKLNVESQASSQVDKVKSEMKDINRQIESVEDALSELSLDFGLKRLSAKYEDRVSTNRRRNSRFFLLVGPTILLGFVVSWFRRKRAQRFRLARVATGSGSPPQS